MFCFFVFVIFCVFLCFVLFYFVVMFFLFLFLCFLFVCLWFLCFMVGFVCRFWDIFKFCLCFCLVDLEVDCSCFESICCFFFEGLIVCIFILFCMIFFCCGWNCLLCFVFVLFEFEFWCFWGLWRGVVGCEVLVVYFYFCLFSVYLFCLVFEYYGEF